MPFDLSSNVIYRVTLQKKTDNELFVVDTKGNDKGICTRTLAFTQTISFICFYLQSGNLYHDSLALLCGRTKSSPSALLSLQSTHAPELLSSVPAKNNDCSESRERIGGDR